MTVFFKKHNIGDVKSHNFRTTFATDLYEKTKDITVVQECLGHKDPRTSLTYVKTSKERMN